MNTSDSTFTITSRTRAVQAECAKLGPDYALWYGYVCGELEKMECELISKNVEIGRLKAHSQFVQKQQVEPALARVKQAEAELAQIRATLQAGLDRDKDDTTTPHLAVVAVNGLAERNQLREEVAKLKHVLEEHAKGNVTFHGLLVGEDSVEELLAARAELKRLKDQIGYIEAGEHPDEQKPRAATWLQERKNWAAEVERLRNALATIRS